MNNLSNVLRYTGIANQDIPPSTEARLPEDIEVGSAVGDLALSTFASRAFNSNTTNPTTPSTATTTPSTATTTPFTAIRSNDTTPAPTSTPIPIPLRLSICPTQSESPLPISTHLEKTDVMKAIGERFLCERGTSVLDTRSTIVEPQQLTAEERKIVGNKRLLVIHNGKELIVTRLKATGGYLEDGTKSGNLLGKGANGSVYRVTVYTKNQKGALKIAKTSSEGEPLTKKEIQERKNLLVAEAVNLLALEKLNIGVQPAPYALIECINGNEPFNALLGPCLKGDLFEIIGNSESLKNESVSISNKILKQLVDILNNGWRHGDLKPDNIYYEDDAVKIGDWAGSHNPAQLYCLSTLIAGTQEYVRESDQIKGEALAEKFLKALSDKKMDVAASYFGAMKDLAKERDILAAGVTLFITCTGGFPFNGLSTEKPGLIADDEVFPRTYLRNFLGVRQGKLANLIEKMCRLENRATVQDIQDYLGSLKNDSNEESSVSSDSCPQMSDCE